MATAVDFGGRREMHPIVSDNLDEIRAIYRKFGVARLELFGSAARVDFDPETSDIDVIVDFIDYGTGISDRFFGLINALEELLGRPIDVVFARKLSNPYFIESVNEDRITLYAAQDRDVAA